MKTRKMMTAVAIFLSIVSLMGISALPAQAEFYKYTATDVSQINTAVTNLNAIRARWPKEPTIIKLVAGATCLQDSIKNGAVGQAEHSCNWPSALPPQGQFYKYTTMDMSQISMAVTNLNAIRARWPKEPTIIKLVTGATCLHESIQRGVSGLAEHSCNF